MLYLSHIAMNGYVNRRKNHGQDTCPERHNIALQKGGSTGQMDQKEPRPNKLQRARKMRAERAAQGFDDSTVIKKSVVVAGHKTSISLEEPFWRELRSIAKGLGVQLSELVGRIDAERHHSNLSSAIRLFVFDYRTNADARGISEITRAVLDRLGKSAPLLLLIQPLQLLLEDYSVVAF